MHKPSTACVIRHFIISPYEIHYLRFILEAYEGIGVLTTLQPRLGLVRLSIAPGCEDVVEQILEHERERLQLRPVVLEAVSYDRVNDERDNHRKFDHERLP